MSHSPIASPDCSRSRDYPGAGAGAVAQSSLDGVFQQLCVTLDVVNCGIKILPRAHFNAEIPSRSSRPYGMGSSRSAYDHRARARTHVRCYSSAICRHQRATELSRLLVRAAAAQTSGSAYALVSFSSEYSQEAAITDDAKFMEEGAVPLARPVQVSRPL